jgi:hypothetical protein
MKLDEAQINELFRFTEKKYVRWYDLQVELVDHLASKIEELMSKDNKLSFEHALQKVYAEFGIFGFAKVVQHAQQSVVKKNRMIWWRAFQKQFVLPNLIRSACFFIALIIASTYVHIAMIAGSILLYVSINDWLNHKKLKRLQNSEKNLLLLASIGYLNSGSWILLNVLFWDFAKLDNHGFETINFYLWFTVSFLLLIHHLATKGVKDEILAEARALYPEGFKTAEA